MLSRDRDFGDTRGDEGLEDALSWLRDVYLFSTLHGSRIRAYTSTRMRVFSARAPKKRNRRTRDARRRFATLNDTRFVALVLSLISDSSLQLAFRIAANDSAKLCTRNCKIVLAEPSFPQLARTFRCFVKVE